MSKQEKKSKCPGCNRSKAIKHFTIPAGRKCSGNQYPFGLCRHCTTHTKGNKGQYIPRVAAMVRRNCPEYLEHVRAFVREEMRRKRLNKDQSYHQGIVRANQAKQVKAIQKLHGIQGNYCATGGTEEKECNFHGKSPNLDHIKEDGRFGSRETYLIAAEVLKMDHPESKYQLLCQKHNMSKYRTSSPYLIEDNKKRVDGRIAFFAAAKKSAQEQELVPNVQ